MKLLIQIVVVGLLAGGLAAAGSFYWDQQQRKTATNLAGGETQDGSPSDVGHDGSDPSSMEAAKKSLSDFTPSEADTSEMESEEEPIDLPVGARPPFDPTSEEAAGLINSLRQKVITTADRERRFSERQSALRLVFDDLRQEQSKTAQIRQRLSDELSRSIKSIEVARQNTEADRVAVHAELDETRHATEQKIETLRREKDEALQAIEGTLKTALNEQNALRQQLAELKKPKEVRDRSGLPEENLNLEKMADLYDQMPPENTAKILQEMVQNQRTEAVVVLLNAMKPRLAAKTLSAISDTKPALAADLSERLKRLKLNP